MKKGGRIMVPNLKTERLILRERSLKDLEDCLEMDRDPEVVRHIPEISNLLRSGLSEAKQRSFIQERMQEVYTEGLGYWTVEKKEEPGLFLGWVMLIPLDGEGPEIEVGWRLKQKFWGNGYATEAALAIVDYAFQSLKLGQLVSDIQPHNLASIRVAEKLGFREKGSTSDEYIRYVCIGSNR